MLAKGSVRTVNRKLESLRPGAIAVITPPAPPMKAGITPPAPASPRLLAVGRRLISETDRLVEKVVKMIRDIPEYRRLKDEAMWTEVRQILRANIPVFFNAVIEGRLPKDEEVAAARHFARRRVHQGISLRGHLTAYRNGMWMLWEELVASVAHRPVLQKELLLRASWAFQHLDIVTSAVSEAYYAEQQGRARHRDRMMRDLFDEIIDGGPSSPEDLKARAASVELDLDSEFHILVVFRPSGRGASPRLAELPSVTVVVAEATGLSVERVVSVDRNRELLVLTPRSGQDLPVAMLRAKLVELLEPSLSAGVPVVIGISGVVSGIEGIREGYKESKRATEIGQVLDPTNVVHFYDDYVLHDVLDSGAKPGKRLIGEVLGSLLSMGDTGQRLIETLRAYFNSGLNLKVAAGSLDIHPNTLAYRMRQVHQLTGLDPGNPDQRLRSEIAVNLYLLQQKREALNKSEQPAADCRASQSPAKTKKPVVPRTAPVAIHAAH
ncbi:MAG: PucR family transcriptional regulator [Candidatus Binatia bacterium]